MIFFLLEELPPFRGVRLLVDDDRGTDAEPAGSGDRLERGRAGGCMPVMPYGRPLRDGPGRQVAGPELRPLGLPSVRSLCLGVPGRRRVASPRHRFVVSQRRSASDHRGRQRGPVPIVRKTASRRPRRESLRGSACRLAPPDRWPSAKRRPPYRLPARHGSRLRPTTGRTVLKRRGLRSHSAR